MTVEVTTNRRRKSKFFIHLTITVNALDILHSPMTRAVLEKELNLIRHRLDAIETALGKEMTPDEKAELEEALEEHEQGKSIKFRRSRRKARRH
jgi:hypothetical protein